MREKPERESSFEEQLSSLKETTGAQAIEVSRSFLGRPDAWVILFDFGKGPLEASASITLDRGRQQLLISVVETGTRGEDIGTRIVRGLVKLSEKNKLTPVALGVLNTSEGFWVKQDFTKCPEPNPDNNYWYKKEDQDQS